MSYTGAAVNFPMGLYDADFKASCPAQRHTKFPNKGFALLEIEAAIT